MGTIYSSLHYEIEDLLKASNDPAAVKSASETIETDITSKIKDQFYSDDSPPEKSVVVRGDDIYVICRGTSIEAYAKTMKEAQAYVETLVGNHLISYFLNHWVTWREEKEGQDKWTITVYRRGANFINGFKSIVCQYVISKTPYVELVEC